jgi:hypothetical protein
MTYVVRRFKPKLLVLSRLARSTCCQRSVRIVHLSGSVLDRVRIGYRVLELVRYVVCFRIGSFLAPFPDYRQTCFSVNSKISLRFRAAHHHRSRLQLEELISELAANRPPEKSLPAQIFKDQPVPNRKTAQANFGLQGARRIVVLGSCNGIVLCGIPYRGSGALASPVPTNRLLSPLGWP